MQSELWARTWQVVSLGMISTFAFIGLVVVCLKIMGRAQPSRQAAETEKEKE